jgi:hypothetical protein
VQGKKIWEEHLKNLNQCGKMPQQIL